MPLLVIKIIEQTQRQKNGKQRNQVRKTTEGIDVDLAVENLCTPSLIAIKATV